jgi:hypothetical protein
LRYLPLKEVVMLDQEPWNLLLQSFLNPYILFLGYIHFPNYLTNLKVHQ